MSAPSEALSRALGCAPGQVGYHLVTLPAWDPCPAPGRSCVRLTALVRSPRALRAVVFEAPTETDALARLCAEGIA